MSRPFTFGLFWDTLRRCKLYDYEQLCWLDFQGRPTSEPMRGRAGSPPAPELAPAAE